MRFFLLGVFCINLSVAHAADIVPLNEDEAPGIAGDICADGKPHTFRLQANRDKLLATLAAEKHTDACTLWGNLSLAERDIFEMVTAYLGSCDSRLFPPPSQNDDTLLDKAAKLYSINGPGLADIKAAPVPSEGGACGGYNSNRVFIGFNEDGIKAIRDGWEKFGQRWGRILNPKHVKGYNWWRASNDLGGPHTPFTHRDMICWGGGPCWLRIRNSEGPTWHFFADDGDLDAAGLRDRRGVCGIADPHIAELTIAFNWTHESDPLCAPSWKKEIIDKIGPVDFRSYKPNGSCNKPAITIDPGSGKDHGEAGLGPDQLLNTCLDAPKSQAPATATLAPDAADRIEQVEKGKFR
jgi:hypothetical protein